MSFPNGKEVLVQTVDDLGAAVLIVGSRGLNALSRSLWAHLTQPAAPTRIIAIAIDGSSNAEAAFVWALNEHIRPDDLVILLHVQAKITESYTAEASAATKSKAEKSSGILAHYVAQLTAKNLQYKAVSVVGNGKDAQTIVAKVEELQANTLIMGSRGQSTLAKRFLGSTSDYCAHNCNCPVVIV
ncbi:hypothetical protein HDU98_003393 [Podochytrium sp. JEL0797]|nr:hypothetical protein HDU98_003393 [Podochytrium sp. JEL0797]